MISSSEAYKQAITADVRKIYLKANIDIIPPDISYTGSSYQSKATYGKTEELYDDEVKTANIATLERNRWILGDTVDFLDGSYNTKSQVGYVGNVVCGADGKFNPLQYVLLRIENVSIIQGLELSFGNSAIDGVAENFTVEIIREGTASYTQTISGNHEANLNILGFSVTYPEAIRILVTKWSIPFRRMRLSEINIGIHIKLNNDNLVSCNVVHQADISDVSLPNGTCEIEFDNSEHLFDPISKDSIFRSIEDRQPITVQLGVLLDNDEVDYKPLGTFFQGNEGWKTDWRYQTLTWNLIDIIGLIKDKRFIIPTEEENPQNVEQWVRYILRTHLGKNFEDFYTIPSRATAVYGLKLPMNYIRYFYKDVTCGKVLQDLCMAADAFMCADPQTGKLKIRKLEYNGTKITLDNMISYPVLSANTQVSSIVFTLPNEEGTQYIVPGNSQSASNTISINNPFLGDEENSDFAARYILPAYGGQQIEVKGRGDPSSEIGDVDTIEIDSSTALNGRRIYQDFVIRDGVLTDCTSRFLQADGIFLYQKSVRITKNETWKVPDGVTEISIVLIGGGSGGSTGEKATEEKNGEKGEDGQGGRVYTDTIEVTPGTSYSIRIGEGGKSDRSGEHTTFGSYSSIDGVYYNPSYNDVSSGKVYARSGIKAPAPNTGDGGQGGKGGGKSYKGNRVIFYDPEEGTPGGSGCVIIYYNLP